MSDIEDFEDLFEGPEGEDMIFENDGENNDDNDEDVSNVNTEYELEREEPVSKNADEFAKFLHSSEFPDDITTYIKSLKLFERNASNGNIVPTKSLDKIVAGFGVFLIGPKRIPKQSLRGLAQIFGRYDIFHYVSSDLCKRITNLKETKVASWANIFQFMQLLPHPIDKVSKPFFGTFLKKTPFNTQIMKRRRKLWVANDWEKVWQSILMGSVNSKVALKLIPYVTDNVLSKLKTPFKSADFFFKMFDKKDIHAILSLGAIFKLITEHNFEYPMFYDKVYSLIRPSLLYMDHKAKVLGLLDNFLSSTHIPIYIVASFIKKLSRCLILAPVHSQEPIIGLIKNLIIRHPNCTELIHREIPKTVTEDPFDDDTTDLKNTKALESSLWEMKLLQNHWNQNVRKRAHFIENKLQNVESYVRFREMEDLFNVDMAKSFGGEHSEAEKFRKIQDGDDDDEPATQPRQKKARGRNGGKYAARHEEKVAREVAINSEVPMGIMERNISVVDVPLLWSV